MSRELVVLTDEKWRGDRYRWILWIGQCSPAYFLVWGHLEDAFQQVAEWCAENAPGRLYPEEAVHEAYKEALAEFGPLADERAWQKAEQNLTCLGGGLYVESYDWGVVQERPTREQIQALKEKLRLELDAFSVVLILSSL